MKNKNKIKKQTFSSKITENKFDKPAAVRIIFYIWTTLLIFLILSIIMLEFIIMSVDLVYFAFFSYMLIHKRLSGGIIIFLLEFSFTLWAIIQILSTPNTLEIGIYSFRIIIYLVFGIITIIFAKKKKLEKSGLDPWEKPLDEFYSGTEILYNFLLLFFLITFTAEIITFKVWLSPIMYAGLVVVFGILIIVTVVNLILNLVNINRKKHVSDFIWNLIDDPVKTIQDVVKNRIFWWTSKKSD
jgi:hypothetical protein